MTAAIPGKVPILTRQRAVGDQFRFEDSPLSGSSHSEIGLNTDVNANRRSEINSGSDINVICQQLPSESRTDCRSANRKRLQLN